GTPTPTAVSLSTITSTPVLGNSLSSNKIAPKTIAYKTKKASGNQTNLFKGKILGADKNNSQQSVIDFFIIIIGAIRGALLGEIL
ncbi:MAG: hypothetical protein ACD_46C00286G0001, partial [uncultured bacterium]